MQFSSVGTGIEVTDSCTVTDCQITNCATGITMGTGCKITACNASVNTGAGFEVGSRCQIADCHASDNENGFLLMGSESTIWHNSAVGNTQRGFINIGLGGNLIVGNAASANAGNYLFAPADTAGPIITSVNIAASSNPHGNYRY